MYLLLVPCSVAEAPVFQHSKELQEEATKATGLGLGTLEEHTMDGVEDGGEELQVTVQCQTMF